MKFSHFLPLAGFAALTASADGAAYSTNFNGYALGDLANAQPATGWTISDSTQDASFIQSISGTPWNGRAATLGYVSPLQNNSVFLSHAATVGLMNSSFQVTFQVQDSDSGFGGGSEARDVFGFRLVNGSGDNLFSFYLNPFDQSATPETDTGFHTFAWNTGTGSQTVVLDSPLVAAQENFAYTLTVSFALSGSDIAFTGDVNGSVFSGVLAGLGAESVGRVGAFWNTLNGASAPGSNFLIFDNISMVPEPSVALLGLMGGICLFRRRRA